MDAIVQPMQQADRTLARRRMPAEGQGDQRQPVQDRRQALDDSLGGRAYYLARAEIRIPLGSAGNELGIRPSIFADVGALWSLKSPTLTCQDGPTAAAPRVPLPGEAGVYLEQEEPVSGAAAAATA